MKTGLTLEYQRLRPYLPETIASVLGVGCGDGGMSMLLGVRHGTREFHLLEGDEDSLGAKRTGYRQTTTPWRSPKKAIECIRQNVPDATIKTYTPSDPWPPYVDLIMSQWSWGFHYPLETYLDRAAKIQAPLMLDLRRRNAKKAIRALQSAGYTSYVVIWTTIKAFRIICRHEAATQ
jgi:hypothetical protein